MDGPAPRPVEFEEQKGYQGKLSIWQLEIGGLALDGEVGTGLLGRVCREQEVKERGNEVPRAQEEEWKAKEKRRRRLGAREGEEEQRKTGMSGRESWRDPRRWVSRW